MKIIAIKIYCLLYCFKIHCSNFEAISAARIESGNRSISIYADPDQLNIQIGKFQAKILAGYVEIGLAPDTKRKVRIPLPIGIFRSIEGLQIIAPVHVDREKKKIEATIKYNLKKNKLSLEKSVVDPFSQLVLLDYIDGDFEMQFYQRPLKTVRKLLHHSAKMTCNIRIYNNLISANSAELKMHPATKRFDDDELIKKALKQFDRSFAYDLSYEQRKIRKFLLAIYKLTEDGKPLSDVTSKILRDYLKQWPEGSLENAIREFSALYNVLSMIFEE
jgi:hypothetical protein